jgi:hypothetical protein
MPSNRRAPKAAEGAPSDEAGIVRFVGNHLNIDWDFICPKQ